jgi:carnosine N-methyltransferase
MDGAKAEEVEQEREAFIKICRAIQGYAADAAEEVHRWERMFERLPPAHQTLLAHHRDKHVEAYRCVSRNDKFLQGMLATYMGDDVPPHLRVPPAEGTDATGRSLHRVAPADVEKVRYVLKNLARDWSAEAAGEREQSHGPIIRELTARLPPPKPDEGKYPPRVLVPGAGLGRLVMEIARRGYEAEGNEFSYYMLLTSSYVLNHADDANEWVIHPWVHSNCNHQSDAHQLATVRIPDVPAWSSGMNETGGSMSMCAGDFVECYGDEQNVSAWDSVCTCFFIDTAHNVVEYLQVISRCLKPGGTWINFGPLLYHWAEGAGYVGTEEELSVEMSLDDVCLAANHVGLRIEKREMSESRYTSDPSSMLQTVYNCALVVAVKVGESEGKDQG